MGWVTVVWSGIASACLTLALIHLLVWVRQRGQWVHLLFVATALSAAAVGACELLMMRTQAVAQYATVHRWIHVPLFFLVVSMVWFVRLYFRTGRIWLAWVVCAVRGVALLLNFLSPVSLNFTAITALQRVDLLGGETVSVAQAVLNPWGAVGPLSSLLLVIFVLDASVALWRRGASGDRHRAPVIGGSITLFVLAAASHAALVHLGLVRSPYLISVSFLAIVLAMSAELGSDALRAAQLARSLRESEQRMRLAADAAELGMWAWDMGRDRIWATDRLYALFGLPPAPTMTPASFLAHIHPEDREAVRGAVQSSWAERTDYAVEFRLLRPDGAPRWIAARGRVQGSGEGARVLGVCRDVTVRRQAEEALHDLSARLIHAQEEERKRLARELHDELGQRLALLSAEINALGRTPLADPEHVGARMQVLSAQVQALSSEVHRLSHELLPANLQQLGLVPAVRGLCRELAAAHGVPIELEQRDVPDALPKALALCLYRIAQEALSNALKHSDATTLRVSLTAVDHELRLAVTDDGRGFDPAAVRGTLGLLSMKERARLVHGQLAIRSCPGAGTQVEVRVPLPAGFMVGSRLVG